MQSNKYIPGVCNINKKEIERRKNTGKFSFFLAISYMLITTFLQPNPISILFLFGPIFGAVINYIQVTEKFCAQYGLRGIENTNLEKDLVQKVAVEGLAKDKEKSVNITMRSIIYSVIITLVYLVFYILVLKK